MAHFNPSRLDLARRRRGYTKGALAKAAEIAPRTLAAYERGETEPNESPVARLAVALAFPVSFFVRDDADELSIDGVSFRALSGMTARQRDQACGAAAIALELDGWARDHFDLPAVKVPRLRGMDAEAAAEAVRIEWGLGEQVAPNMVHLLEAHGVRVFSLVQECAEVDAFSFWHDGTPYVFLNGMKTAERGRMDAAHELGHLVLHYWGGPKGRPAENEAQLFGASFLMPRRDVLATMPHGASVPQIIEARKRWRVAAMNLAVRMARLELLTEWQARSTYIQLGQRGFRAGEPGGIERETSQIWDKVFTALRSEGTSRADVARQLDVNLDDLNASVFGLVVPKRGAPASRPSTDPAPSSPPRLRVV